MRFDRDLNLHTEDGRVTLPPMSFSFQALVDGSWVVHLVDEDGPVMSYDKGGPHAVFGMGATPGAAVEDLASWWPSVFEFPPNQPHQLRKVSNDSLNGG